MKKNLKKDYKGLYPEIKWIPWWQTKSFDKESGVSITDWIMAYNRVGIYRHFILVNNLGSSVSFKQETKATIKKEAEKMVDIPTEEILEVLAQRKKIFEHNRNFITSKDEIVKESSLIIMGGFDSIPIKYALRPTL